MVAAKNQPPCPLVCIAACVKQNKVKILSTVSIVILYVYMKSDESSMKHPLLSMIKKRQVGFNVASRSTVTLGTSVGTLPSSVQLTKRH